MKRIAEMPPPAPEGGRHLPERYRAACPAAERRNGIPSDHDHDRDDWRRDRHLGRRDALFAVILYLVVRYVAQPWVYFSRPDRAKRLILGLVTALFGAGVLAILIGVVKAVAGLPVCRSGRVFVASGLG